MAGAIIEGVGYAVVRDDASATDESVVGSATAGEMDEEPGEYVRALQTFGENRGDHTAALEVAILGWLDAKRGRSGSQRTWRTYADTLYSFRAALKREGLDLDGPSTPVALVAQAWAGSKPLSRKRSGGHSAGNAVNNLPSPAVKAANNVAGSAPAREPAPTTYNQRLASVSSFYKYARKQGILDANPIERVERRRVQAYAGSRALEADYVKQSLASIDRSTAIGSRDYALLLTYLQTGRRLSEVAALESRDLEEIPGGKLRVTFRRCKGGKVLHDTLTTQVTSALLAYLYNTHRLPWHQLDGNTPV